MGVDVMKVILALSLAAALMVCFSEAKSAEASHILVASESQAADLKKQIDGGADFAELAKKHSTCPSGKSGGSLGEFGPDRWSRSSTRWSSTTRSARSTAPSRLSSATTSFSSRS